MFVLFVASDKMCSSKHKHQSVDSSPFQTSGAIDVSFTGVLRDLETRFRQKRPQVDSMIWFKILRAGLPSHAVYAPTARDDMMTILPRTSLVITLHDMIAVLQAEDEPGSRHRVALDRQEGSAGLGLKSCSLTTLLDPAVLTLRQMKSVERWPAAQEHSYYLDIEMESAHDQLQIPYVATAMMRHGAHLQGVPYTVNNEAEGRIMDKLEQQGLVHKVNENERAYVFTHEGLQRTIAVDYVTKPPSPLLEPECDKPWAEQTTYELLLSMERNGWRCRIVPALRKRMLQRAEVPEHYTGNAEKVWVLPAMAQEARRSYLILLLSFSEHQKPVPHIARNSTYADLLAGGDGTRQARKRKLLFMDDDIVVLPQAKLQAAQREDCIGTAELCQHHLQCQDFPQSRQGRAVLQILSQALHLRRLHRDVPQAHLQQAPPLKTSLSRVAPVGQERAQSSSCRVNKQAQCSWNVCKRAKSLESHIMVVRRWALGAEAKPGLALPLSKDAAFSVFRFPPVPARDLVSRSVLEKEIDSMKESVDEEDLKKKSINKAGSDVKSCIAQRERQQARLEKRAQADKDKEKKKKDAEEQRKAQADKWAAAATATAAATEAEIFKKVFSDSERTKHYKFPSFSEFQAEADEEAIPWHAPFVVEGILVSHGNHVNVGSLSGLTPWHLT